MMNTKQQAILFDKYVNDKKSGTLDKEFERLYLDYSSEMSSGSGYVSSSHSLPHAVDTKRRAIRNLEKYATDNELI